MKSSFIHFQSIPIVADRADQIAILTLNRAEASNAFSLEMIKEISDSLKSAAKIKNCRALIVRAAGKNFSAGADLNWMKNSAKLTQKKNLMEAKILSQMFLLLAEFPLPTIAIVQGAAFGGAVGLAACCDTVIVNPETKFCLSEVRIGLIPAVIYPFLANKMTHTGLRRLSMSARVFNGQEALTAGLADVCITEQDFDSAVQSELQQILQASPDSQGELRSLAIKLTAKKTLREKLELSQKAIAKIRTSKAGQSGLAAFLAKTKSPWHIDLPKTWRLPPL